jgi:hypothetical protein
MDIENMQYYEAGIAQGVTAGSLITLFICMLCWQCNRPPRRGVWYKVADALY